MTRALWLIVLGTFILSLCLTWVVVRVTRSRGLLDVPNERSSHTVPTPRGAGVATVAATVVAWLVLAAFGEISRGLLMALLGGGVAVAVIGYLDDLRGLSASVKFSVHVLAALWALAWLGGLPPLQLGSQTYSFGMFGYVLGVLGIGWTLNLFNFMDGIDGLAASEAIFVAIAGAAIAYVAGGDSVTGAALVFAAGCAGLLAWNWPPAKIFMGDVGSGYMGYVIAVLAIAAAHDNPVALLLWVMLGALFFVDASITLARRVARGEPAYKPHRDHAYQKLARRWTSHRRVTVLAALINVLWLLPCCWVANRYPTYAGWMLLVALLPVAFGILKAGAGRASA